ncbi:YicC family protein [Roseibium denhamense]|uniref:TIGR00255 family protein n=1 Tax=Roseibium denhamense TaxID=76305 RepID=A0ABY1NVH8_9HYPH|nr:YicC/YloC family endoribonuclease [Roseibium denhamense]MTI05407.1 YicC family protein [Roseibium denhamense]SMP17921.1 TIGR00255 family protein [Roseibium denhamense]
MALASMTGFARSMGESGPVRWTWELRSVNGKSLDLRIRIPTGLETLEPRIRERCAKVLRRGNVSIGLSMQRDQSELKLQVNETALEAVLSTIGLLRQRVPDLSPPSIDGILSQKGVFELKEPEDDDAAQEALHAALLTSLDAALLDLVDMRHSEGHAIAHVVRDQIDRIAELTRAAEDLPVRQPEAIRAKLKKQVDELLEASGGQLDPQRLHQEAIILATKADIREELDRLHAHVAAVRELMDTGGAIGRRVDFLAQEFNREANTLCSKSNDVDLTSIGLDLKAVIDQMREQIQNLE